ncbi:hypothetical protein C498_09931 [Haloferax volcanii DS2]|uniref:Uncharacterized protein n=1 Tax=Haloferax volcanii (strain ATCC 29605 / DSM 3757 / JCM 8879 / NBRC 14742 / NCIMB 2012 / VKM B-1768 / DS2) TaxID=309800 RepID=L9V411_HALVD|nr:hypothetical protein C498_09931 [Haloferax volcanii DS2]
MPFLFTGIDWSFILRLDFVTLSPLPVVVAFVVDLFDRNRRLRGDIIWKVIRPFFEFPFRWLFLATNLTLLVFGQLFGIAGNVSETVRR